MNLWKWIKRKIHKWTSEPKKVKSEIPDHPMCRCDPILKISSEGKSINYKYTLDGRSTNDGWLYNSWQKEKLSKIRHKYFLITHPEEYTPIYEISKEEERE